MLHQLRHQTGASEAQSAAYGRPVDAALRMRVSRMQQRLQTERSRQESREKNSREVRRNVLVRSKIFNFYQKFKKLFFFIIYSSARKTTNGRMRWESIFVRLTTFAKGNLECFHWRLKFNLENRI